MRQYHQGYGDPMHELMGKQKRECHGCIHKHTDKAFGVEVNLCKLGNKRMYKCEKYQENNNAATRFKTK